jgi:hypothetical protein
MVSARLISSFFSIGIGSIIALMNISLEISNQYQIKNLNSLELPTNQILTTNLNNIPIIISLLPHFEDQRTFPSIEWHIFLYPMNLFELNSSTYPCSDPRFA